MIKEYTPYLIKKLPSDLHRRLKIRCTELSIDMMDFIIDAIKEKLRK